MGHQSRRRDITPDCRNRGEEIGSQKEHLSRSYRSSRGWMGLGFKRRDILQILGSGVERNLLKILKEGTSHQILRG